jgi:hypothetical protein
LDEAAVAEMGGGGPARASVETPKKEEEEEETEISPMMFLANNQLYFDHLFDLLNLDNINKEKVRLLPSKSAIS